MYKAFNCGNEITIWCEGRLPEQLPEPPTKSGRKRKAQECEEMPSTKKCDLIDQTAQNLYEKHGERFAMPQLRLWARMVVNKQYTSLDVPPPYPPFKDQTTKTPSKRDSLSDALTSAATAVVGLLKGNSASDSPSSSTLSPGKRARVYGQYLEQLERIKGLHESGVLSSLEFEEQKKFALDDIRKLKD